MESVDPSLISASQLKFLKEKAEKTQYADHLTKRIALRRFLRSNSDYLLLLEDDVVFTATAEKFLEKCMEVDIEVMFVGGATLSNVGIRASDEWAPCSNILKTPAIFFNRIGATKVLSFLIQTKGHALIDSFNKLVEKRDAEIWGALEWCAVGRRDHSETMRSLQLESDSGVPCMLDDDVAVLDAALNEAKLVVEYGSGASTLYIAERLKDYGHLISIEHDPLWFQRVRSLLAHNSFDHVTYCLKEPLTGSTDVTYQKFSKISLRFYIHAPEREVRPESVDLVFVDGRQRVECAIASARWLKKGGYLMIHDFWPRLRYRVRLTELLTHYHYILESPCLEGHQGIAVFVKR